MEHHIRPAVEADTPFLAWVQQEAARSHLPPGFWDLAFPGPGRIACASSQPSAGLGSIVLPLVGISGCRGGWPRRRRTLRLHHALGDGRQRALRSDRGSARRGALERNGSPGDGRAHRSLPDVYSRHRGRRLGHRMGGHSAGVPRQGTGPRIAPRHPRPRPRTRTHASADRRADRQHAGTARLRGWASASPTRRRIDFERAVGSPASVACCAFQR